MERDPVKGKRSISEVFDEVCPYYLMAGMTYEQFWDGKPEIAVAYRRKLEIEGVRADELAWLHGEYVFIAVSTALSNAFRGKGKPPIEYLKKPLLSDTLLTDRQKEQKAEAARESFVAKLNLSKAKNDRKKKNGNS